MAHGITISDFSFRYTASGPDVLASLSLDVDAGSCCAVIGPTGAGKTSLLHSLAGTMRRHHPESVSTGTIKIGTMKFEGAPKDLLFPATGLVLQDPYVQISGVRESVLEEVRFTLEHLDAVPSDADRRIRTLLHQLGIEHLADRKPTSLSGGETQRLALATMLIAQPPVLLLDEPTTALDTAAQERLRQILHSLKGTVTVVLTDTLLDFALSVADSIAVIDHGRTVLHGSPGAILSRLNELQTLLPVEGWLAVQSFVKTPASSLRHRSHIARVLGLP